MRPRAGHQQETGSLSLDSFRADWMSVKENEDQVRA
jgi:hypothetical protein